MIIAIIAHFKQPDFFFAGTGAIGSGGVALGAAGAGVDSLDAAGCCAISVGADWIFSAQGKQ